MCHCDVFVCFNCCLCCRQSRVTSSSFVRRPRATVEVVAVAVAVAVLVAAGVRAVECVS